MADVPIEIESLLAHREWVRRTARALAGDADLGDDLAQEVFLKALRRPPRHERSLRAWLGTALRRTLYDLRRGVRRARRREAAVAVPEHVRRTPDIVAEAGAHRAVVDAVLRLPEPSREAVLLRYFRGLAPPEIARELGVPLDTAKTRLRRGLERLRADLSDREGGLAGVLAPLLAAKTRGPRLAGPVAAAKAVGGVLMGTKAKLTVFAAVLALVGVGVSLGVRPPPIGPTRPTQPEGSARPVVGRSEPTAAAASDTSAVATAPAETDPAGAPPGPGTGACHGKLVFSDGTPAAGVTVWMAQTSPVETDREGRFRVDGVVPIPGGRDLLAGDPKGPDGVVRLGRVPIRAGEDVELNPVLPFGASIPVEVRSAVDGSPVAGASVTLYAAEERRVQGWTRTGDDGRGRLTHVAPGEWEWSVKAPGYTARRSLLDVGDDPGPLRVRLDPAERLLVRILPPPAGKPNLTLTLAAEPGESPGTVSAASAFYAGSLDEGGIWTGDAPPPGRYRGLLEVSGVLRRDDLEIEVLPRSPVEIVVKREVGVSVEGRLVAADGGPVRARVSIGSRRAETDERGEFRFVDVVPGRCRVNVHVAGGVTLGAEPAVVDVPEAGLSGLEVRIPAGGALEVRIAGAKMPGTVGLSLLTPDGGGGWRFLALVQPNAADVFEIPHLPPGRLRLALAPTDPEVGWAPPREIVVREAETEEVEIRLRENPEVVVLVRDAAGAPVSGRLELRIMPLRAGGGSAFLVPVEPDDEGRAVLRALSPGRKRLTLTGPDGQVVSRDVEIREADNSPLELRLPESPPPAGGRSGR